MKALFKITGFLPYILIIFLNAMTDLGHKIILQNTIFKAYDGSELIVLTAIVNALILLPFIFLFSPAGFISDKYPKTKVIEVASGWAIVITTAILISYYMGWFWVAFGMTLVLAAQSAIYSPAKYGLIKEMAGNDKLASANALVQAVTIVSILAGAVLYSLFFETLLQDRTIMPAEILQYVAPVGYLLILGSVIEYMLAKRLAKKFKEVKIKNQMTFSVKSYKNGRYLQDNLGLIKQNHIVWNSIIGLSIFWGISQVVVAVFGDFLKSTMHITDTVVSQGLLSLSGIGIILGSLFAGRMSRDYIETGTIPLGAMGIAVSLYMLPSLHSLVWLGFDLVIFGFFAGLFLVPLNSLIQFATPTDMLGKILAGNNFMQNVLMFLFLILTAVSGYIGMSSGVLFYIVATIAFLGMGYTLVMLPQSLVRYIVKMIIGFKYKLSVSGLDNIDSNKGILLLGNHISYLDWAILQMAYPKQIRFVMDRSYYEKWYFKPFLNFFKVIPISTRGSKTALQKVTDALNEGHTVAIFPEGYLSRNGHLGEFQRGFEMACKDVKDAVIVPFYTRGLWEDRFSHASKKLQRRKNSDINVHFGSPIDIHSDTHEVKKAVFDLSVSSWNDYAKSLPTLQKAWIHSAKEVGAGLCISDSTGVELSGDRFITGTFMIASALKTKLHGEQNIGLILPTSAAGSMGNMAVLSLGKTIVNLNYTSGIESIMHAVDIAEIKTIITSKQFITRAAAKGFDLSKLMQSRKIIYLEDVKEQMSKVKALMMLMSVKLFSASILSKLFIKGNNPQKTAAILFSSGSEGRPKGIELTHTNVMGNIKQTVTVFNPTDDDVMLGTLPIFHSFGLTVTTLLPLIEGVPVACHPDPTDGVGIGKIAAKYHATILFGTATFFRLYAKNRKLLPLMFENLRLVVAGAEKLPNEIREQFKAKFGKYVYEGYGTTETTPVAGCNIPDKLMQNPWKVQVGNKMGTIGLPVPGSNFRIVDPETYQELPVGEDGMILIGGTQIMKGYIGEPEKTDMVIKELDGIRWYITGDKGHIDTDGFLSIVDRYSRFAKIGGEMISLGLVETEISKVLDEESQIAITAIPDEKKGERLVLLYEGEDEIEKVKEDIKAIGLNPLFVPTSFYKVESIPKLGTGKSDFKGAKSLALELEQS